jgi:hypothetical protein
MLSLPQARRLLGDSSEKSDDELVDALETAAALAQIIVEIYAARFRTKEPLADSPSPPSIERPRRTRRKPAKRCGAKTSRQ